MATITSAPEILDSFIISFVLVPKMQTLDLLIPSWRSWHNGRLGAKFKKSKIQRYFRSQLSTIQIQTNATLPNEQNRNLASPIPKRKKIAPHSFFSANFI